MRIVRYLFVGGTAAVVDIGLFSLFAGYLGWPWIPVSVVTFILATLTNYFLSIQFVFESGARHKKHVEMLGVFIVSGLALLVNQVVLYLAIEILGWHLILSKIVATGIVFFWNYYGRSKFIF
ncbi:GtrA family protein [Polynucleobacter paneuropaeus]|nr:GtrA family protein [Polynucleobacter paneuropaeus]